MASVAIGGIVALVVNGYRNGISVSFTDDGDIRLGHVHRAFREAVLAGAVPPLAAAALRSVRRPLTTQATGSSSRTKSVMVRP